MKVVILGGYGVFGGRLARLLLQRGHKVVVAGRSLDRARAFTAEFGGTPLAVSRDDVESLRRAFQDAQLVVDAAGPFQHCEDYALAQLAIACGCHAIDLSDDARFSAGIGALDVQARDAERVVLSGVSSVPALSAAVVHHLKDGFDTLAVIEAAILPGNQAPRGRSVMAAILTQVGSPIRMWRGRRWVDVRGWSGLHRMQLTGHDHRDSSFIGAPDLWLFPAHFNAGSVLFRAGLELRFLHRSLSILARLRAFRLLPRLDHMTGIFHLAATLFERFGSNRGGMVVRLAGRDRAGQGIERIWRLHIGEGRGPFIPALPALVATDAIARGEIAPGARPALDDLDYAPLREALEDLGAQIEISQRSMAPLFETALGEGWAEISPEARALHDLWDRAEFHGRAEVIRGTSLLSRIIAAIFRFPPAASDVALRVQMVRQGAEEIWERRFANRRFRSVLSPAGAGRLYERFGPFRFELSLPVRDGSVEMPVRRGWFLGLPLPAWSLPRSETREYARDGRFHFDVRLSVPLAGLVVHYRGTLDQVRDDPY